MATDSNLVFSVGHSTHPYERFVGLLRDAGITAVADVRTHPHSRFYPQFNKGTIEARLRADGIAYSFLGEELGGRPSSAQYYRDGVADYERMANAAQFHRGLERVMEGAQKYCIALMCAEQDPLDCHRCLLVARALAQRGMEPRHILPDGQIVSQTEIEVRLLQLSGRAATISSPHARIASRLPIASARARSPMRKACRPELGARSSRRAGPTSAQQKPRPRRVAPG
jgi:uncharacterized protein (DUF488 family)